MTLEIQKLSKHYGTKRALNEVNLRLTPGVYGLLGPNGAGKSTLMNIIAGNVTPTGGQVLLDGTDIFKMGKAFRKIFGYMPQQQNLYPEFTADRFLAYMAALKRMKKQQADAEIEELLETVNLKGDRNRRLGGFSGGMKQRILIAQALLNHPQIIVLDEPTAGLDPKERIRIRNMIAQIALERIVLIATHVVSDIEFIAKEIILLKAGKVVSCQKPEELIAGIDGKVYEIHAGEEQLDEISSQYTVANIAPWKDGISVRVLSETEPSIGTWQKAAPSMEDVYLYTFGTDTE